MADINSPSSITIGELSRIIKDFEEKFKDGTEDPDRFLTLAEIEELWGKLIGDTNILYTDMIERLIYSINEKDVIRNFFFYIKIFLQNGGVCTILIPYINSIWIF